MEACQRSPAPLVNGLDVVTGSHRTDVAINLLSDLRRSPSAENRMRGPMTNLSLKAERRAATE